MADSMITRDTDALAKQPEKTLWYMHVAGPDDMHAVPDYWTGLAWAAELNGFIAERAAKEKWAADDNWPLTQATIRRWTWSAEQHATMLARELSERQEHAEKRAAALAAKAAVPDALAKLAEIPPAGSEERDFWLEAAEQHGLTAPGESALPTLWMASETALLTLMSEARKQGQRDAMIAGIQAGLDAAIRGIDATILNMGGECSRRGIQDPETGEVPCEGEEDRGCACSEAMDLGARLIKNLRSSDVAKIAALATGGARHG